MNKYIKTLLGLVTVTVLAVFLHSTPTQAVSGRIAWFSDGGTNGVSGHGTNLSISAVSTTITAQILSYAVPGSRQRTGGYLNNQTANALWGRFSNIFRTNDVPDFVVPGSGSVMLNFGEGYNGAISIRSSVTNAGPAVYWTEFGN